MKLLGKLTLSILGFHYFGIIGLLWGLCLGHLLIDRTIISRTITNKLLSFDDSLRMLLPYKYYAVYDKYFSHLFGFIWGLLMGIAVFNLPVTIGLIIFGHIAFDMNSSSKIRTIKNYIENLFNKNIFTVLGLTIGLNTQNTIITTIFLLIGFIIDTLRSDSGLVSRLHLGRLTAFWPKASLLKISLHSTEARKFAFVKSMTGLVAKLSKASGEVSNREIAKFIRLFDISKKDETLRKIFNEAQTSSQGFEPYVKQIKYIVGDNLELQEDVIENLFEIAVADGEIVIEELNMLKEIAKILSFPDGNFEVIRKRYEHKVCSEDASDYYAIMGADCTMSDRELRLLWRKLTSSHHPDKILANGGTAQDVFDGNKRMAEINDAYQQIMKQRSGK